MAKIALDDNTAVVIIGSGAGGGTLANELCQKGVKVVLLEAGKRESAETFQNNEWGSFGQLSWLVFISGIGGQRSLARACVFRTMNSGPKRITAM